MNGQMERQVSMRMGIRWRCVCGRIKGCEDERTSTALHVGQAVDKVGMGVIHRTKQGDLSLAMTLWSP